MDRPHVVYSFTSKWVFGSFRCGANKSNALMNFSTQVFVCTRFISLGHIPRSGIVGLCSEFTFNLLRNYHTGFQSDRTISCSHHQHRGVLVYRYPHQHFYCLFLTYRHPNGCEIVSCDFNYLHFPNDWWCWMSLPIGHLYAFSFVNYLYIFLLWFNKVGWIGFLLSSS